MPPQSTDIFSRNESIYCIVVLNSGFSWLLNPAVWSLHNCDLHHLHSNILPKKFAKSYPVIWRVADHKAVSGQRSFMSFVGHHSFLSKCLECLAPTRSFTLTCMECPLQLGCLAQRWVPGCTLWGFHTTRPRWKGCCSDKGWKRKNNKIKLALDPIGLNPLEHLMKFTQRSLVVPLSPLLLVTTTNKSD